MFKIGFILILVMIKAMRYVTTDKAEAVHLDNVIIEIACMIIVMSILSVIIEGIIKLVRFFLYQEYNQDNTLLKTNKIMADGISFIITLLIFNNINIDFVKFLHFILS